MAASQAGLFNLQVMESDGTPAEFYRLYTYVPATTTHKIAYTESTGTTAHTYSSDGLGGLYIALDARGELPAPLWLTAGGYDIHLKSPSGTSVWTRRAVGNDDALTTVLTDLADDSDAVSGAGLIGWAPDNAYASGTVGAKLLDWVSVKDFGAIGDGSADDTAEIQAAIDSFGSGNGGVFFPAGTYKVTSTLTVDEDRMHLFGLGGWASRILFAPTADDTCLHITAGASVLFQGSVRQLCFYSDDSTYTKIAIEASDTSGYAFEDIVIGGSVVVSGSNFWSGGVGSIGFKFRGREATTIRRPYVYADRPVLISDNPNGTIDIDHFHFEDTYLAANGFPKVEIESGVNLTNVTFDGYNAWVRGTEGLKWVDTTSTIASQMLMIRGVRHEQCENNTAYVLDIQHNSGLQNVSVDDCHQGPENNGYRFREVSNLSIRNNLNPGASGRTHLDVDATVVGLRLDNCFWQALGSATMTGQRLIWAAPKNPNTGPLPPSAIYDSTTNDFASTTSEAALGGYTITVANNGTANLGDNLMAGTLYVTDSEGLSAAFEIRGTYEVTSQLLDGAGAFSHTAATATSTNVYWSAANSRYEIENKRGDSRNYRLQLIGSYESF